MIIQLENFSGSIYNTLRSAGYSPLKSPFENEKSFIKRIFSSPYPRFHIYFDEKKNNLFLHLDQKQARYKSAHDHAGEYKGNVVEKEAERVKSFFS